MNDSIYDLVIEVTRRCNMKCEHCLRGHAHNLDFDTKMLSEFIKNNGIKSIDVITFSGGEPSLAINVINECLQIFKDNNVTVESFYIITNAVKITDEFILCLLNLGLYATADIDAEYPKPVIIAVSNDHYHRKQKFNIDKNIKKLKLLNGFELRKEIPLIINEGNAKKNGIGLRKTYPDVTVSTNKSDTYIIEGTLYFNCKGNIINGCDWSYASQNKRKLIICSYKDNFWEKLKLLQND